MNKTCAISNWISFLLDIKHKEVAQWNILRWTIERRAQLEFYCGGKTRACHSLLMTNPASQGIRLSRACDIASVTPASLNPVGNQKVGEKSKRECDQRREWSERYRQ